MSWMFKLRGTYTRRQALIFGKIGFWITLIIWYLLTMGEDPIVQSGIVPSPLTIMPAFDDLYYDNSLIKNLTLSLGYNFGGYIKAILISIPVAFVIGLYPIANAMFQSQIDAYRFIPLTAVTGIFLIAFGIGTEMKINFLAFGIMIYLIPIIIQRIKEVKEVYIKTVYTIGATDWQTIKTVYIPSVLSRLMDDLRVLTAISWTYIIVAENQASQGGLGTLLFTSKRMGRPDKIFAILLILIIIGIIQDRLFVYLDKKLFPHKYQVKDKYSEKIKDPSLFENTFDFGMMITGWILLGIYLILAINEFLGFLGNIKLLDYLFEDTVWVVHFIFLSILVYKAYKLYNSQINKVKKPIAA